MILKIMKALLSQGHTQRIKVLHLSCLYIYQLANKDPGNVSYVCPSIHPVYNIPADDGASNHTKQFTKAAITDEAYKLTITTAQGMAATAWQMLSNEEFALEVKAEFKISQALREKEMDTLPDVFNGHLC